MSSSDRAGPGSPEASSTGEAATPWKRLQRRFSGWDVAVDPRGPMPRPPDELRTWAINVSAVMVTAMLYSGWQERARQLRHPIRVPADMPAALHDKFVQNQQAGRNAYVAGRAVAGGWYAFAFAGCFYGADALLGTAYDGPRKEFTALSGAAAGGLGGATLPGGLAFRLSRAALGAAVGTAAGYAVGWLQYDLVQAASRKSGDTPS
jgi:hypothetical protein